jgi:hypothetical protein
MHSGLPIGANELFSATNVSRVIGCPKAIHRASITLSSISICNRWLLHNT